MATKTLSLKYLGTNLKKAVKGLDGKNMRLYQRIFKYLRKDTCSRVTKLMTILPNFKYKFNKNTRKVTIIFLKNLSKMQR